MAEKFNLMSLLNQRSKEVAEAAEENTKEPQDGARDEVIMVDVYDLIPSKDNFYHVDDELKSSIEIAGILQPLLVKPENDGKYKIIAGHRRRLAALALINEGKEEWRYLPCILKKESLEDRLAVILANKFREKTEYEKMMEALEAEKLAKELKTELDLRGRTREILAEMIGVPETQLGRYKTISNNLIPSLMAEFKAGNIQISVASEIAGLPVEWQEKAEKKLRTAQALTLADIKAIKRAEERSRGVQPDCAEPAERETQAKSEEREEAEKAEEQEETREETGKETEEWTPPQIKTLVSICYSCVNYENCHEKRATMQACSNYKNRAEARKTEEDRYNEEQRKIDRETERLLRERAQEQPIQRHEKRERDIRVSEKRYGEIWRKEMPFLLIKNDDFYEGEIIEIKEYARGEKTGRILKAEISRVWEDLQGLQDGYCILFFSYMILSNNA